MTERMRVAWKVLRCESYDGNWALDRRHLWKARLRSLVGLCRRYGTFEPLAAEYFEVASTDLTEGWHPEWGKEYRWTSWLVDPDGEWRVIPYDNSNL